MYVEGKNVEGIRVKDRMNLPSQHEFTLQLRHFNYSNTVISRYLK